MFDLSNSHVKDADSKLDYTFDWSSWLVDGDIVQLSTWDVEAKDDDDAPLAISGAPGPSKTDTTTTVWLEGGSAGKAYWVSNAITTVSGRRDERTLLIYVVDQGSHSITPKEVKKIIFAPSIPDADMEIFISSAELIVNEDFAALTTMTDERKKLIKLFLAAHFCALFEERGGLVSKKIGQSTEFYAAIYEQGYAGTRYGQQAMALDSSGTLRAKNSPKLKGIFQTVSVLPRTTETY